MTGNLGMALEAFRKCVVAEKRREKLEAELRWFLRQLTAEEFLAYAEESTAVYRAANDPL